MAGDETGADPEPLTYDGGRVDPGERQDLRYSISETYLGDPVRIPVTVVNGEHAGPTAVLTAASHGDELNGIEVVREVAAEWDLSGLHGTLLCLPVLNVPGFLFQQRYLPVYDRDLNRSFPGSADGTSASRIARQIFDNFVAPADVGIDFHTSTRGRTNMLHVRADVAAPGVERLARAFASNLIIDGGAADGTLRTAATEAGVPTITVEMGEAHRFQRDLIDDALAGVASVLAEYDMLPDEPVGWPGWRTVIDSDQKTWLRADVGGIVEQHVGAGELVAEGDLVCTIANPFKTERTRVDAPFDGLLVGVLENPVVYPGNPLCHVVELDADTRRAFEAHRAARETVS
ncbi:MAG: succinylglutamate desuccinylase/aspartoacylase family protein [Halobacteriaceae archaeon]